MFSADQMESLSVLYMVSAACASRGMSLSQKVLLLITSPATAVL